MRKNYSSIQFLNTGAKLLTTQILLTIHRIFENCTMRLFDDQSNIKIKSFSYYEVKLNSVNM